MKKSAVFMEVSAPHFSSQTRFHTVGLGDVEVFITEDFASLERQWRALEGQGIGSLYQRYDWMKIWAESVGRPAKVSPRLALISHGDETLCILPLSVRMRGPFKMVTWLGDSHTNFHMGLYSRHFLQSAKPDDVRGLIDHVIGQLGKQDILELCCQPVMWQGYTNPITFLKSQQSHNHAFALSLEPDFDAALNRNNGARKRKKYRWQQNKLREHGGAELLIARTVEDVDRILDVSMQQMSRRFSRSGIWNRFEDAGVMSFFRELAIAELDKEKPSLRLYGLEIAGEIRATFAGGENNNQFSGCFISLTNDEFARISPGELIIYLVIEDCVKRGLEVFDLGRGEERYKTSWCDTTMPMFETTIALSKRAIAFAAYERAKTSVKRTVRNNETMWSMAKKVRTRLYGRI